MSKLFRAIVIIAVGVLLLNAAGCGTTTKHVKPMSTEEVNLVLARSKIGLGVITCIRDEQRSGDAGKALGEIPEKEGLEVGQAVRELIAAFRKNPSATARTYLAEKAESLQSCWPWLTREIRTVLTYG